jgi:hypothetical protein
METFVIDKKRHISTVYISEGWYKLVETVQIKKSFHWSRAIHICIYVYK